MSSYVLKYIIIKYSEGHIIFTGFLKSKLKEVRKENWKRQNKYSLNLKHIMKNVWKAENCLRTIFKLTGQIHIRQVEIWISETEESCYYP
mgnify:CR=1 FL=1